MKRFAFILLTISLVMDLGCTRKPSGIGSGNDSFKIVKVWGSADTLQEHPDWSIPTVRHMTLHACITNALREGAVAYQQFQILPAPKDGQPKTDIQGCLNWTEDVPFDISLQPAGIEDFRQISANNSMVRGSVNLRVALNPWSGLIGDETEPAVQSPDVGPATGRLMTLAALTQENQRGSLWAQTASLTLAKVAIKPGQHGEAHVTIPIVMHTKTQSSKPFDYPLVRGRVHITVDLINKQTGRQAINTLSAEDLRFDQNLIEMEHMPIVFTKDYDRNSTYYMDVHITPLGEGIHIRPFAGRFEAGQISGRSTVTADLTDLPPSNSGGNATPLTNLVPLNLEKITAHFDTRAPYGKQEAFGIQFAAEFTDPGNNTKPSPHHFLVKSISSDKWNDEELKSPSYDLEWHDTLYHDVNGARVPVMIPIEIQDPTTSTVWKRTLVAYPWSGQIVDPTHIGNFSLESNIKPPRLLIDKLCLGKSVEPRMTLLPNLDLNFQLTMTAALQPRLYYPQDPIRGPHNESFPAGSYHLNLVLLRGADTSVPQVVSTVSRDFTADGSSSLNMQVHLPLHSNADQYVRTQVLAQITGLAGVISEPQLFAFDSISDKCVNSIDPRHDQTLRTLLAKFPPGATLESFHQSYRENERREQTEAQARISADNLAQELQAQHYDLPQRPVYFAKASDDEIRKVLECLTQSAWGFDERKAACQYDETLLKTLNRICASLIHLDPVPTIPTSGIERERARLVFSQRSADIRELARSCVYEPYKYLDVEKKFVIAQADSDVSDLRTSDYTLSLSNAGRSSSWDWDAAALEDETLGLFYFKFQAFWSKLKSVSKLSDASREKLNQFRARLAPLNMLMSEEILANLQKKKDFGTGFMKLKIGKIWDSFVYTYDLDYNLNRIQFVTDVDMDVHRYDVGIHARVWQECYLLKLMDDTLHLRDLICFPQTSGEQKLRETYYYVVTSGAKALTVDNTSDLNRYQLFFRGERDHSVWMRTLRYVDRRYSRNGVPLSVTDNVHDVFKAFARHSSTIDGVVDSAPPADEVYVSENPNPTWRDRFSSWIQKFDIIPHFLDDKGTKEVPNTNSRELNPEFLKNEGQRRPKQ